MDSVVPMIVDNDTAIAVVAVAENNTAVAAQEAADKERAVAEEAENKDRAVSIARIEVRTNNSFLFLPA